MKRTLITLLLALTWSMPGVLWAQECAGGALEVISPGQSVCESSPGGLINFLVNAAQYFTGFVIAAALLVVVFAGYLYMTAGGSADQVSRAKSYIVAALTGVILALLSYAILAFVNPQLVNPDPEQIKDIRAPSPSP